jgi:hypothetical protein
MSHTNTTPCPLVPVNVEFLNRICQISAIYLQGTYSISNYVFDNKGLANVYIPGSPKWRVHMMVMTEAREVLGGYKLFAEVTEIMEDPRSKPSTKNPLWHT